MESDLPNEERRTSTTPPSSATPWSNVEEAAAIAALVDDTLAVVRVAGVVGTNRIRRAAKVGCGFFDADVLRFGA